MSTPHKNGSFSYRTINSAVRKILENRSILDNTIQVAQPFVKVTSTVNLPKILGDGNVGFTLGLHAIPEDVLVEDIYTSKEGNGLIGYTYKPDGQTKRIYAEINNEAELAGKFFDRKSQLATTSNFAHIPPPGITSVTIGRNKGGQSQFAQISFTVPTQSQLEMLHRTLLIPGIGVVVEWGQQFANHEREFYGQRGLNSQTIPALTFPWYDRDLLLPLLQSLGRNEVGMEEILNKYVIPTGGQYMWMFGKVANFSTKSNSDGSFECTMKVVGPAENSWAYNTVNTIVPAKDPTGKVCPSDPDSVYSYFTKTSPGINLKTLLDKVINQNFTDDKDKYLRNWKEHVVKFAVKKGLWDRAKGLFFSDNTPTTSTASDNVQSNTSEAGMGESEDAYFMTWRFFVNVVLNSKEHGIKAIFYKAGVTDPELDKIALLRPYSNDGIDFNNGTPGINDPYENWVGNNENLRSVDPGTMIIVNDTAADIASQLISDNVNNKVAKGLNETNDDTKKFAALGDFYNLTERVKISDESLAYPYDRGLLSTGVWLNHKAVVSALASADTVVGGISNLLQRMSAATSGYWQLVIDTSENNVNKGPPYYSTQQNYTVVDANFRENSNEAVEKFLNEVHTFNKYIRFTENQELVGSDVLDCSVDLNLPKRLFSQIATLGLVQDSDTDPTQPTAPIINDANDTLRKMFSITSLSEKNEDKSSIDLTLQPRDIANLNKVCAGTDSQTTLGTAGTGNAIANPNIRNLSSKTLESEIKRNKDILEKTPACKQATCIEKTKEALRTESQTIQLPAVPLSNIGAVRPTMQGSVKSFPNAQVPLSAMTPITGTSIHRVGQSSNAAANTRYQGKMWLEKEAAAQFQKLVAYAATANPPCPPFRISSAYRDLQHQAAITTGGAAQPGSSPHGMGRAIDFAELYGQVGGSTSPVTNAQNRDSSNLYKWLAANAPAFGWYNPKRLADGIGVDECWHWEYWGYEYPPSNTPTRTEPTALTPTPSPTPTAAPVTTTIADRICDDCIRIQKLIRQYETQLTTNRKYEEGKERVVKNFDQLSSVFRYIEPYADLMVARITATADGIRSNAFGASPGALSINANVELPGIAGLRVGELFWIERIPSYFKAFGAFQTLGIEDKIGPDGWKTSINAKFNYLGDKWRLSVERLLNKQLYQGED